MENLKWLDKWYSKHVIENHKKEILIKFENKKDLGRKLMVNFSSTNYKHLKELTEFNKKSDYNYFSINAKGKQFVGEGDFTKLDFLIGKFRAYIGEMDFHSHDNDFFLNPDIQFFIFEDEKTAKTYTHYTSEKEVADDILKSGFEFLDFEKTTSFMVNDTIHINYNHMLRKPYGKFVIVISIGKKVLDKYEALINKLSKKDLKIEELLICKAPYKHDFNENVFTLHHKFIKGYINYGTGEIIKNPFFNMDFDDESFEKNIK